jgi:stage V sporulation protein B
MNDVIKTKIHAAIKFNMIVAIPSAVGMGVLASPILRLIFGDARELPANFLRLGSIAIVFFALSTLSSAVLQGINRLRVPVINSAISLGIHIVLVIVLLKFTPLSTYALVIGNVTFALAVCILNWLCIEKYMDYHQEILKTFVIPTISSGVMGVAAYFTYQGFIIFINSNTLATLAAILVAVIVYFVFLIFLKGIEESELEFLPKGRIIIRVLKKLHLL